MNPTQHGFRSGKSCLSQLLKHYNKILEELEKSNNVDFHNLDFATAFDKVDQGILLNKFKKSESVVKPVSGYTIFHQAGSQKWRTPKFGVKAPPIPNTYI